MCLGPTERFTSPWAGGQQGLLVCGFDQALETDELRVGQLHVPKGAYI